MLFGLNIAPFIFQTWLDSYLTYFKKNTPECNMLKHYLDDVLCNSPSHHTSFFFKKTKLLKLYSDHKSNFSPTKTTDPLSMSMLRSTVLAKLILKRLSRLVTFYILLHSQLQILVFVKA
ncbi:hypothetical protein BCR41DRAFT_370824 [Lobosporangium transversale]|uniref:Reverse transcriptase domain-containing protein n=1 Tax=Lobosporangium transversale TaxID=64571 RepID=A0A1Y2GMI7_9FUNG|nr:hypothetical protein BCR41DRAFT_370824 [Lobosporangium transversale]ORZ15465.1 hypothetical protein BCR41DRAFT_370824 [Lobosporangium transversale]|eukprot:XP_021881213.1 hypothetical protein BCR41DRAFT_370824 [Lobosporangium transversale]